MAVWAEPQCQLSCFLESVVVATNLQLDVIDGLGAQARTSKEEVEATHVVEGKSSSVACFIQPCLKLHRVLSEAHLATGAVEELLQSLCRQILVHLAEGILQGIRQVLHT